MGWIWLQAWASWHGFGSGSLAGVSLGPWNHHHREGRIQTGEDVLSPSDIPHLWQVHPLAALRVSPIDGLQTGVIKLGDFSQLTKVDGVFPQKKSFLGKINEGSC